MERLRRNFIWLRPQGCLSFCSQVMIYKIIIRPPKEDTSTLLSTLHYFQQCRRVHGTQYQLSFSFSLTDHEGLGEVIRGGLHLSRLFAGGEVSARQMALACDVQIEDAHNLVVAHHRAFSEVQVLHAVPLTSKIKKKRYMPTHVFINGFQAEGLDRHSIALCEQLCCVRYGDLMRQVGKVSTFQMLKITLGMQIQLGMVGKYNE